MDRGVGLILLEAEVVYQAPCFCTQTAYVKLNMDKSMEPKTSASNNASPTPHPLESPILRWDSFIVSLDDTFFGIDIDLEGVSPGQSAIKSYHRVSVNGLTTSN